MSRDSHTSKRAFSIRTLCGLRHPRIPFQAIKDGVLGRNYELSLVVAHTPLVRKLNSEYRSKPHSTNILSFPLSSHEGEIILDLARIKTEAKRARISVREHLYNLFIHGLAHLKGYKHGGTMDAYEQRMRMRFRASV